MVSPKEKSYPLIYGRYAKLSYNGNSVRLYSLHDNHPEALTKLQDKHWKPVIEWAEKTFCIHISVTDDIFSMRQPEASAEKLRNEVLVFSPLQLAGKSTTEIQ